MSGGTPQGSDGPKKPPAAAHEDYHGRTRALTDPPRRTLGDTWAPGTVLTVSFLLPRAHLHRRGARTARLAMSDALTSPEAAEITAAAQISRLVVHTVSDFTGR